MILFIENSKDSIKKLYKVINEFSKVAEYKINIVYTNENDFSNKISENKFKSPFHNIKKRK